MDDLYETNFQSNGGFCEIPIRYRVIHNWSTMNHLMKLSFLEFALVLGVLGRFAIFPCKN
jgi:hypothetical protein